jgi:hypothetical protein
MRVSVRFMVLPPFEPLREATSAPGFPRLRLSCGP